MILSSLALLAWGGTLAQPLPASGSGLSSALVSAATTVPGAGLAGWQGALANARGLEPRSAPASLLLGACAGVMLCLVLFSAWRAAVRRDALQLVHTGFALVLALALLSLAGLGAPAGDGGGWTPLFLLLASAVLLFGLLRQLLRPWGLRWLPALLLALAAGGAALAIALGLSLALPGVAALDASLLENLLLAYGLAALAGAAATALWHAWFAPREGLCLLAALGCLAAGGAVTAFHGLGAIDLGPVSRYGVQLGAILCMALLPVALNLRSHERRDNRTRMGALAKVDPLTGVASHQIMLQRLEQLLERQQKDPGVGAVLRVRVGNALDIREEFGLQTLQNAFVHAGACLTAVLRAGDTAARHREGDFVLIFQGRVSHQQLTEIGQRLIARGLAENPGLPPKTTLHFKIAMAEAPFRAPDAATLLQSLGGVLTGLGTRPGTALRFVDWPDAGATLP